MGERQQIAFEEDGHPPFYLYSHWGGGGPLEAKLLTALDSPQARNRYDDPGYLARIIISNVLMDDILGETGYGISTSSAGDTSYPDLVVNLTDGMVDGKPFEKWIEYRHGD